MSLNGNIHFAKLPSVDMRRSVFKQPHHLLTSFNFGELIPFYCQEVIPGGTYQRKKDRFVLQMSTPAVPAMSSSFLDIFYFFVPTRLVWNHAEHFYARTKENEYVPATEYTIPQLYCDNAELDSVLDVLYGVRPGVTYSGSDNRPSVSALPARSYALIWNEYFRSEELQNSILIDKSDSAHVRVAKSSGFLQGAQYGGAFCPVDKYHDYFTSALLRPLRNSTGVPVISDLAPVTSYDNAYGTGPMHFVNAGTGTTASGTLSLNAGNLQGGSSAIRPDNLYAQVNADIAQLRQAFSLQRMFEKDNLYGGRYTSVLYGHYGVTAPDARLQRPEFLGGSHTPINVQQVLQNSESGTTPLGYRGAFSVTARSDANVFNYTALEHGYIIGVCCARSENLWQYGIERQFLKKKRTDFYWPVLSGLGEQGIWNAEIYLSGLKSADYGIFGYQEYASDYKYKPDRVTSIFRSGVSGSLDIYHYADEMSGLPYLDDGFIVQNKDSVGRTLLSDESAFANQLIMDFECNTNCILPMPVYNVPAGLTHMF